jgi:hypothetical protein
MIISNFVPPYIQDNIHARKVFDEEKGEWLLKPFNVENVRVPPDPKSARVNFRRPTTEFARIKRALGDHNPRYAMDNVLELELDPPERTTRDYQELIHELEQREEEERRQQVAQGMQLGHFPQGQGGFGGGLGGGLGFGQQQGGLDGGQMGGRYDDSYEDSLDSNIGGGQGYASHGQGGFGQYSGHQGY